MRKTFILLAFCVIIGLKISAQGCVSDSPFTGCAGRLIGVDDMKTIQLSSPFSNTTDSKTCPACGENKPLESYYKTKQNKDGLAYRCKSCDAEYRLNLYHRNAERERENARKRRKINPEAQRAQNRRRYADPVKRQDAIDRRSKWLAAHPEKKREYRERWQENHPEQYKDYRRKKAKRQRKENWPKHYAITKKYRQANKEIVNETNRVHYHRRHSNGGSYTKHQWKTLCAFFDNCCAACGTKAKLTVDHITATIAGGTSDISNIQPLCGSCNSRKHAKSIDYRTREAALWAESQSTFPPYVEVT